MSWRGNLLKFMQRTLSVETYRWNKKVIASQGLYYRKKGAEMDFRRKLVIAIDVSGSVSEAELMVFYNGVYSVIRQILDLKNVDILLFGEGVVRKTVFSNRFALRNYFKDLISGEKKIELRGGGSSAFKPVLDYLNSVRYDYDERCLVAPSETEFAEEDSKSQVYDYTTQSEKGFTSPEEPSDYALVYKRNSFAGLIILSGNMNYITNQSEMSCRTGIACWDNTFWLLKSEKDLGEMIEATGKPVGTYALLDTD